MHLFATDKYVDRTQEFKDAAKRLGPSDFAHGPDFDLYQAISAHELGNPKMDTGLRWQSFGDQLAKATLPNGPDAVLAAMDALFCREVAWLQGSTLVQTVFSGLFVEEHLQKLKNPNLLHAEYISSLKTNIDPLAVYVLATLKSAALVIEHIMSDETAIVSIEEEFHVDSAGWSLLEDTPVDDIIALVEAARAHCKSNLPEAVSRLDHRIEWLFVLKQGLSRKQGHVIKLQQLVEQIEPRSSESVDALFTSGIQARSDGFCLERPLITLSYDEARKFFLEKVIAKLLGLGRIFNLNKSAYVLGFFLSFSKEDNNPLVRVLLKNIFKQQDLLGVSAKTWFERDLTEMAFPAFPTLKARIVKECKQEWEVFSVQAHLCYFDLLTCLCLNRCRQRQMMFQMVAAWDSLHVAGQNLDRAIVNAGFGRTVEINGKQTWALETSTWVYQRKLQMMLWSTLMSFEQDMVGLWEGSVMYWFANKLAVGLVRQLQRLRRYFEDHNLLTTEEFRYVSAMDAEARCMEAICAGAHLTYLALEKAELVAAPKSKYTNRALVYGLRVECFEAIGLPANPEYSEYEKYVSEVSLDTAIKNAKTHLSRAQSYLKLLSGGGDIAEVSLLKRSVFGMSACLLKLKTGEKVVKETEGYHGYFPVPVVS